MRSILWQIWQAVKAPPDDDHPLYLLGGRASLKLSNLQSCLLIFAALFFIVPMLVLVSTVIGALAAAVSAAAVSKERESNRFDLLATTPEGIFGTSWLLSLGAVHRRDAYQRLQSWYTWGFRAVFIFISYLVFEVTLALNDGFDPWHSLVIILGASLILLGFYIDHIQALSVGVLVGLATPTFARDRIGAETGAVLFYLLVRVFTLLAAFAVMFGLLSPLFALLPQNVVTQMWLQVAQFVGFVLVNEAVTRLCWYVVQSRIVGDDTTVDLWGLPSPGTP